MQLECKQFHKYASVYSFFQCKKNAAKIFCLLDSNKLVLKSSPTHFNPSAKLSSSKMKLVPGYKSENCSSRNVDTVIKIEKNVQVRQKESDVDRHLRQMNHTLALESFLTRKMNNHSLFPKIVEELLRREVMENVLSVLDANLLGKMVTCLGE